MTSINIDNKVEKSKYSQIAHECIKWWRYFMGKQWKSLGYPEIKMMEKFISSQKVQYRAIIKTQEFNFCAFIQEKLNT